jgi:alanyl-tRNA synthetase
MKTNEVREKYLSFFESKGCVRKPSDVLVPKADPTVLFTPAGMNQFKGEFLGVVKPKDTKVTTCQKCLRTGDISNVGVTAYHHTFFEMLGNFSFGDYFKREAIHWAWEFLTDKKWLGIDGERLTVSVYKGKHGFDEEAYKIWNEEIGIPDKRIACLEEDENYWPASAPSEGPDGVCGPCSEIFYHPPGFDGDVEIWNLVFTQFERKGNPPDNLAPLPAKNIDTGMGLERTAAVMQGVLSNFDNDLLKPLCLAAAEVVGVKYDFDAPEGRPIRRIADHVRACTFAIHEGVAPDKDKESYVVRQLLRRASLEGFLLGKEEPFLSQVVPAVVDAMKSAYPDIAESVDSVQNTIKEEEEQFLSVIDGGLARFKKCAQSAKKSGGVISGKDAFTLHTQEGFLMELTEAMAEREGLKVDEPEFKKLMDEHGVISTGGKEVGVMAEGPLDTILKEAGESAFEGYDAANDSLAGCKVVGMIADDAKVDSVDGGADKVGIVLDKSPFYGEAGGQVGDTGVLAFENASVEVTNTQKHAGLLVHVGKVVSGTVKVGDIATAQISSPRREGIRRAHSATHILHHALHQVIGDKATQRGSKVEDDTLRFDFAHGKAVGPDEIEQIENIINTRISEGADVTTELLPIEEARAAGAMALFGEKYPDLVRVVRIGDFSTELCGGTHLSNSGQVGLCKIVSEDAVSKGVRRISAVTGQRALERVRETENLVKELSGMLKATPADLPKRVGSLQDELKEAKKKLADKMKESVGGEIDALLSAAETVGDTKIVAKNLKDVPREALRDYADQLKRKCPSVAVVLGTVVDGKVALICSVTKELTDKAKASDCVKLVAGICGGGGGGRPDMAEAGAKIPEKLDEAIEAGAKFYREALA